MKLYTRKRTIKVKVEDLQQIIYLARARTNEAGCLECGGYDTSHCSPTCIEHKVDCPGAVRSHAISDLIVKAFQA